MNAIGMRESALEKKLVRAVKDVGGLCWKFTSPGLAGVPDRLCMFPGGWTVFVEMKAPGGKLRPLQEKRHEEIKGVMLPVYTIDSLEGIADLVEQYGKGGKRKR